MNTVYGDILSLPRGILVHGCNAHGVMGGGIARLIREKWPQVYTVYNKVYRQVGVRLGDTLPVASSALRQGNASLFEHPLIQENTPLQNLGHKLTRHVVGFSDDLPSELIVVNAITQYDFGSNKDTVYVDYDALEAAFKRVYLLARDSGLPVHFPAIGCGLANGEWAEVARRIESALGPDVQKTLWLLP